jgi:hypothetical protein
VVYEEFVQNLKMDYLITDTQTAIFCLLNKDVSVKDYEKWIYENDVHLETELQPTLYFDLISFNYKQKDSFQQLSDKLTPYIDKEKYDVWRIKQLLIDIIEDKVDLVSATRKLRSLYFETGENLIPITLGIGYESEIGDYPTPDEYHKWSEKVIREKLEIIEAYRNNIVKNSKQFLEELNRKGKTSGYKK